MATAKKKTVRKKRSPRRREEVADDWNEDDLPVGRARANWQPERTRKRKIVEHKIRISKELEIPALDLAQNMILAGYSEESIRAHMDSGITDDEWQEYFLPPMKLYRERMNAMAVHSMYLSALAGKVDAQKCIAIMQLGWQAGEGDWDEGTEPLSVKVSVRPRKGTNGSGAD